MNMLNIDSVIYDCVDILIKLESPFTYPYDRRTNLQLRIALHENFKLLFNTEG